MTREGEKTKEARIENEQEMTKEGEKTKEAKTENEQEMIAETEDKLQDDTQGAGKKHRIISKADMLLLLGIFGISLVFWAGVHFLSSNGANAVISVDGRTVFTVPLSEDTEKVIETEKGTNTVRISGGEVSVISADCPDKLCVKHSAIHISGDTIVCLPHKLVVEVVSE